MGLRIASWIKRTGAGEGGIERSSTVEKKLSIGFDSPRVWYHHCLSDVPSVNGASHQHLFLVIPSQEDIQIVYLFTPGILNTSCDQGLVSIYPHITSISAKEVFQPGTDFSTQDRELCGSTSSIFGVSCLVSLINKGLVCCVFVRLIPRQEQYVDHISSTDDWPSRQSGCRSIR